MTKKEQRLAVFNKYNGHCAYCGQKIELNEFEVDHIEALHRNDEWGGSDTFENMNPACMKCNRSKSTFTIEKWREQLYHKVTMLNRDSSTYRVAKKFGLVQETDAVIQFYYERFEKLHLQNVIVCCPVCKSEDISDNSQYKGNGILGPGASSWKVTDTRKCNKCGVIFEPIKGN